MRRALVALLLTVSIAWVAALVTAPIALHATRDAAVIGAASVYAIGSLICHQRPERSFSIAGAQLPVCARCTGLYLGGALGVVLWSVVRSRRAPSAGDVPMWRWALMVCALPTALTVATASAGLWDPHNVVRFALALPLGAGAGALFASAAAGELR